MLDICIVSYNTPKEILSKTLSGIFDLNNTCPYEYQVHLMECGFGGSSSFYLSNKYKTWYTKSPKNLYYVKGNEYLINNSNNKYVLIMSPDCWGLEENWIARLIKDYEAAENCGIMGAILKFRNGQIQHSGAVNDNNYSDWPMDIGQFNEVRNVPWVIGALQLIRRDLIKSMGGINPTNYCESEYPLPHNGTDREVCNFVRTKGYEIYCSPIRFTHPAKVELDELI